MLVDVNSPSLSSIRKLFNKYIVSYNAGRLTSKSLHAFKKWAILDWHQEIKCNGDNSRTYIVSFRSSLLFILHSKCLLMVLISWYKVSTSSTFLVFDVAIFLTASLAMWAIHLKAKKETLLHCGGQTIKVSYNRLYLNKEQCGKHQRKCLQLWAAHSSFFSFQNNKKNTKGIQI